MIIFTITKLFKKVFVLPPEPYNCANIRFREVVWCDEVT
jgi:hypothetical protein